MPYIAEAARQEMHVDGRKPDNAGELNYAITLLIKDYWLRKGRYQAINDIVGALDGAKMEFYRRVAAPYEDEKIKQNGDVYE